MSLGGTAQPQQYNISPEATARLPLATRAIPMFIPTSQVSTRLGVSRSTVERLRRNPEAHFPKPIRIGPNSIRYNLAEIEQWLESRRQGREI